MIGPTPPPINGSSFATLHLIQAVRKSGKFAAHLETGEDERPVFNMGELDPQNVYLGIKHVLGLIRLLATNRGADLHVPIAQNGWGFTRDAIFIVLGRLARRKVVIHLYGGLFADFYASLPPLPRLLIRTVFRCVTEAWVETPNRLTIFDGLLPRDRVRVLENTSEDIGLREAPRDPDGRTHLLFLANLVPEKGHGDLIGALEILAGRGVGGIDLHLIGQVQPDEAERVCERAASLADADIRVELLGTVLGPGKIDAYRWADILVLPSRYPPEGQPLVLLEAMSAGLPIIATDHSGIPLTVLDEQQGLIVPKGDPDAIASAVERLHADPGLRARLGQGGRERYLERYSRPSYDARVAERLALRV